MKITISHFRRIHIIAVTMCLLLTVSLFAADTNTGWNQYTQAASLYRQHAPAADITKILEDVQKSTSDSVLYGRTVFLLSSAYEREHQYDKALTELQKINSLTGKFPNNMVSEAHFRRSLIYLKKLDFKAAEKQFQKSLEFGKHPFLHREALLGLAWLAADQNKWSVCDSLLSLQKVKNTLSSQDERGLILTARSAIARSQPEEAISLLENTTSQAGLYYLAQAHEMAGNRIMAVSVYKKLHDLFPNTPEAKHALFQAAEVFMRAGDWLAARSEFKRLLESGLSNADGIHFRLGWIYMNLNELENALAEFSYMPAAENVSYFKYMEAECLRRQGQADPANLNKSILLFHNLASVDIHSPLAPLAKLKAALTEMEKGDSTGSLVSLRQFISLYPKDELSPAVYFLLGMNENPANSQRYFDQIVQQNRKSQFFDVAYFALQNHDFNKNDYQRVVTRNASIPKNTSEGKISYWQRANHLLMGESAYFLKHYNQAQTEYELAAGDYNDDLAQKAHIGKAWCALQVSGPGTALPLFDEIRSKVSGVNKALADYGSATAHFMMQQYEQALRLYPVSANRLNESEMTPVVIQSLFRSAQCYLRLQYYIQAIETWDILATDFPNSTRAPDALFNTADIYFRANHFSKADSVYNMLISRYPDHDLAIESSLKLAQSAYNAGDYETAVSRYQTFINEYPEHSKNKEALEGIQLSYYQMGQINQASETLQKVIEQTSNSDLAIDARYRIAVNHYQEQNYQMAVEAFKEILTLYPNSSYAVDAQFALSKCYLAQNNYRYASEELLRFIQYFPGSPQLPEASFLLGVSYYQLESYLSAIDYFSTVVQNYSESEFYGPALKNMAWCYDRLEENEKALQTFKSYLDNYPKAEDKNMIRLQIARLLNNTENSAEAIKVFVTLQNDADPAISMEASYRLGMLYLSQEQVNKAINAFSKAVNSNGGENYYRLSSMAQLAAIYENTGDSRKAISTYEMLASSTSEEKWITAARERISLLQVQASPDN